MNKFVLTLSLLAGLLLAGYFLSQKNAFSTACLERTNDAPFCRALEKHFFLNKMAAREISPTLVGALALPVDSKIRFLAFHNPYYFSRFAYCYFVFRGWLDPKSLSPSQMALTASGFAVLASELKGYGTWLLFQKEGLACQQSVQDSLHLETVNLEKELENSKKDFMIAVNPVASIGTERNIDAVVNDAKVTINHERIRAIQASCNSVEKEAKKYWSSLSAKDKKKFVETYPTYNWNDGMIAVREAFAYHYEKNPEIVQGLAKECTW